MGTVRDWTRFVRAAVIAAAGLSTTPLLGAQGIVALRANGGGRTQVAPGAQVTVPLVIDMVAAGGTNLASLAATVSWGSSRLTFDSVRTAGFGTLVPSLANAASGSISLSTSAGGGTTSTVTMANVYFTASATSGGTLVTLGPTAASDNSSANILARLRVANLDVCVAPTGVWGDVTGDDVANIIDAQQVARFTVGLSVGNPAAVSARGDVNADSTVNIIDAQQIARFSVGLSASARVNTAVFVPPIAAALSIASVLDAAAGAVNPGVPANTGAMAVGSQAQVRPLVTDASSVDVTSCATIAYSSSNPSVATISASGLAIAVATGNATLTVTSGTTSANVNVTVSAAGSIAVNSWTNSAGGLWTTAANWSLGRVPLAADSVVIDLAGTYTVTLDSTVTAAYVTVGCNTGTQTLSMASRTLTVSGMLTVNPRGVLSVSSSTLNGPVLIQGLVLALGSSSVNGALTTAAGSTQIGRAHV